MILRYFLNDFEIVPVAPLITDITSVFIFIHILKFFGSFLDHNDAS